MSVYGGRSQNLSVLDLAAAIKKPHET